MRMACGGGRAVASGRRPTLAGGAVRIRRAGCPARTRIRTAHRNRAPVGAWPVVAAMATSMMCGYFAGMSRIMAACAAGSKLSGSSKSSLKNPHTRATRPPSWARPWPAGRTALRHRTSWGVRFMSMASEQDRLWVGSMPEAYDRWLAPPVFRPYAQDLGRRAARLAPRKVLEIAAGTGVLTNELTKALPGAEVTATDLNAAMVEFGSRRAPGAEWRQADALDLPFGDGRFDLVACQFGVMFFPDKPAAFAEVRRVLAPGGALLFTTWGDVATHGFAVALVAGIKRAYPEDPPAFVATVPHGYFDLEQIIADLAAGGMGDISAEVVTLDGHAGSAADLAAGFCAGTPLRMEMAARGDLEAGTKVVAAEMTARLGDGPVTAPMAAYVVEARPSPPG